MFVDKRDDIKFELSAENKIYFSGFDSMWVIRRNESCVQVIQSLEYSRASVNFQKRESACSFQDFLNNNNNNNNNNLKIQIFFK